MSPKIKLLFTSSCSISKFVFTAKPKITLTEDLFFFFLIFFLFVGEQNSLKSITVSHLVPWPRAIWFKVQYEKLIILDCFHALGNFTNSQEWFLCKDFISFNKAFNLFLFLAHATSFHGKFIMLPHQSAIHTQQENNFWTANSLCYILTVFLWVVHEWLVLGVFFIPQNQIQVLLHHKLQTPHVHQMY